MPNVIDPHFSTGFQVRDITYAVFDTLFAVDDQLSSRTPQMVGAVDRQRRPACATGSRLRDGLALA